MPARFTYLASITVEATEHDVVDDRDIAEVFDEIAENGILDDTIEIAMEMHDIDDVEVVHIHISKDSHAEQIDE